jgi:D-sedoheptulose 7-phosphate isomerase
MSNDDFFSSSLRESAEVKLRTIESCRDQVLMAVEMIAGVYNNGGKVLLCGNGGSAADCQHLATELMIRLNHDIQRPALGAISLCTDPSNLTAGGNDIGFENVFARNVEGLGSAGDVLVAISTSGRSPNVMRAVEAAKRKGMKSIGLLGGSGGTLKGMCDIAIVVPSENTQRIQETHITIGHIICESVEQELYGVHDQA